MINSFKLAALKKIENEQIKISSDEKYYYIKIDCNYDFNIEEDTIKKLISYFKIISISKKYNNIIITLK